MPRSPLIFALCAALLGSSLRAGPADVLDWIEPGSVAYQALLQAASEDGATGWAVDRLKQGRPLPQASARDLSAELLESPRLSPTSAQALKAAFPDEFQAGAGFTELEAGAGLVRARIESLETNISQVLESKRRNNYSPVSNPQVRVGYTFNYSYSAMQGLKSGAGADTDAQLRIGINQNYSNASMEMWAVLLMKAPLAGGTVNTSPQGWSHQSAGNRWDPDWHHTFGIPYGFSNMGFTFTLDPDWFRALKATVGDQFINMRGILGTGRRGPQGSPNTSFRANPFFKEGFAPVYIASEDTDVGNGSRSFQGLKLEKSGSQGWWIFDQAAFIFQPYFGQGWTNTGIVNQQDTNFGDFNVWAGRLDLTQRDLPLLSGANIWISHLGSQSETDFTVQPQLVRNHSDAAFSAGFSSMLGEGGQYGAEFAVSDWRTQGPQSALVAQDLAWTGQAMTFNLSKAFAPFSFVFNFAEVGPQFVLGPRNGLWSTNGQFGGFLDSTVDDPRPGNLGQTAWQTLAWDSENYANNTRQLSLNLSYASGWATAGVNLGFATQIQPSGPWIQTAHYLDNNWTQGTEWGAALWSNRIIPPGYLPPNPWDAGLTTGRFNYPTLGTGPSLPLYKGAPVSYDYSGANGYVINGNSYPFRGWNWQDAQYISQPAVFENLLLSQNGLGDPNLRADSVKTLNFIKGGGTLDLQALFDTPWPLTLQGDAEVRSVAEQAGLASYSDQFLLAQLLAQAYLSVGLTETLTFQGYLAQENWLSIAGYYPLESRDFSWGWGFDLALSRYLSGLNFNFRAKNMAHEDLNYAVRNWTGYRYVGKCSVTY